METRHGLKREPATPIQSMFRRLLAFMLPALVVLSIPFFVPSLNPPQWPRLDLTGPLAVTFYWIAESGGPIGTPLIGLALTMIVMSRPGIAPQQRVCEFFVITLTIAALLGGGAYLNEFVVKPAYAVFRPNIIELAETPPEAPILRTTPKEFYALPDKGARSDYLSRVLPSDYPLHERVRAHWIAETGYSFPSGHSFSAMMFATFLLGMAMGSLTGKRLWVFYLLPIWALAVCFSRPMLRVHSPADILVGGLQGFVAGLLALAVVRRLAARVVNSTINKYRNTEDGQ